MQLIEYVGKVLIGAISASIIGALAELFPQLELFAWVVLGAITIAGAILAILGLLKLIREQRPVNLPALAIVGVGCVIVGAVALGTGVVSYALR